MQTTRTAQLSLYLVITSCLMHIFCCGLPLLFSLGSLAAVAGVSGSEWLHSGWFGRNEMVIYVASGALLLITGAMQYIASRIDCRTDGDCHHGPCAPKKNYARWVFAGAVALYVVNSVLLVFTH